MNPLFRFAALLHHACGTATWDAGIPGMVNEEL
jgi:hypothetical protein